MSLFQEGAPDLGQNGDQDFIFDKAEEAQFRVPFIVIEPLRISRS